MLTAAVCRSSSPGSDFASNRSMPSTVPADERAARNAQPAELPIAISLRAEQRIGDRAQLGADKRSACAQCGSRSLCLANVLDARSPAGFDGVFGQSRKIRRGEVIYRAGDTFQNLYVARAGSSKTVTMHHDGREQITGFQIAGELIGMDGLVTGEHALDAIALEDSLVCVIAFRVLETLGHEHLDIQRQLHRLMSREIVRESAHMMLIGTMTAEERVASFLIDLSRRYQDRGYSPMQFHLRMTREEIGSYLGMTLETVSRMLNKLQRRGCIEMQGHGGKEVRIVDIDALARI